MKEKNNVIYSVIFNYPDGPRFRIQASHLNGFPSLEMFQRADLILDLTHRIVLKDKNYRQFQKVSEEEYELHSQYPLICWTCKKINEKSHTNPCWYCKGETND